jgi:hypothetical protein
MKVIFLDIDGVLNNVTDTEAGNGDPFALDHKNWNFFSKLALTEIVKKTGAKVVISSSWRKMAPDVSWWNEQFALGGIEAECIDITGSSRNGFRGREVRDWLKTNPVESYVILDDESDFYRDQPRVWVDMNHGLRPWHVEQVVNLLNNGNFTPLYCMEERNPPADG